MGIVTDIMGDLDSAIGRAGETLFEATAISMTPVAIVVTTLMLVAVGIGMAFGSSRIDQREGLGIMIRIVMVFMFGLSWANFGLVYDALANGLQNLGITMFRATAQGLSEPTAVAAMDSFAAKTQSVTNEVIRAQSSITRGIISAVLFVFLALFNAYYVCIVGFAKIMIAVLVAVAPLAIVATLFEKTKNLFETWLSSLIGYSLWPVAAAAVAAIVTLALDSIAVPDGKGTGISAMLSFFVLNIVAIYALMQIPTAVANISGQVHLGKLGGAGAAVAGAAAGYVAGGLGKTAGQFLNGAKHAGQTTQQTMAAAMRGGAVERGAAEAGSRMAGRLGNAASKAKSNLKSVSSRK